MSGARRDESDESDEEPTQQQQEHEEASYMSERRRRHAALLATWIKDRADTQLNEAVRTAVSERGVREDEQLSIQELMKRHTNKKIITSPREYQVELFERAKKRNTLAVLDTGSGKTLIAALLIRWTIEQELQRRVDGDRAGSGTCTRRITFFIVSGVALAFQQHSMLACNLNHNIAKLYGNMNDEVKSKEQWRAISANNMAIVCTAEILHQCLIRSFLAMSEINLLIFDEAHHAKKNHNFSLIMKNHYHKTPVQLRPRIFGMTASPVDAKVDVEEAARNLECLLDAQIATSRLTTMHRPSEKIIQYHRPPKPYSTPLSFKLSHCFGRQAFFDAFLTNAQLFAASLGSWCGDEYWKMCLSEAEGPRMENEYKRGADKSTTAKQIEMLDRQLALVAEAREITKSHDFRDPDLMDPDSISHKVISLKWFLDAEYENPTDSKCIVFVGHRQIAFLLVSLFQKIGSPHLRCAVMVGTKTPEIGELPFTLNTQIRTLAKFERGEYNCLFATTVAEEGLDIADCNLIVRYDLYNTMIQYVQSRGRARHHNSKYIHMLENGNDMHHERFRMAKESEQKMRDFVEKLPPDRILDSEADLEQVFVKEKGMEVYRDPTTGAQITYNSSLTLLHHFLDLLPQTPGMPPPVLNYIVQPQGEKFICEIIFPDQAPIKSVMGRRCARKGLAKRSAAFNACISLKSMGLLDEHLMPTIQRSLPLMRNARLALAENRKSSYEIRRKPDCWKEGWGTTPGQLFATVFDFDVPQACGRPHVPLAMLTRNPMPEMPSFPLWTLPEVKSDVLSIRLSEPCNCDFITLSQLTAFTLRIFKDIFNKEYEHNDSMMSYWIAPIKEGAHLGRASSLKNIIDWEAVAAGQVKDDLKWDRSMPLQSLLDRYIVDPGDGSRRFFTEEVAEQHKPTNKPPPGVYPAKPKYMGSIIEYSSSTWGSKRDTGNFDMTQPVFKTFKPTQRRDVFREWSDKEIQASNLAYICLEPMRISCLSAPVVTMAYMFPAIVFRIESYLIAQEACKLLDLTVEPGLALEALTKDSDNTEQHRREQIQVQRGMGRNYERLEFLGDCFLKMATTISLFTKSADDEFTSHVNRMVMICNKNLYTKAVDVKLYEYIRAQGFSRRVWYPEGLKLLRGKGAGKPTGSANDEEQVIKKLSDKTVADVCEALIGAALLTYTDSGDMDMAVKAVTTFVSSDDHTAQSWAEYYQAYHKPGYQTAVNTAAQAELAKQVYHTAHRYRFHYPRVLQSAFTHPSWPFSWDQIPNYQRLEFLGDSLLDMVAVNYLYARHPDRDPQWLTEHKMAIVSNKFLGALAVELGFNRHLRSYNSAVLAGVKTFVDEIEEARKKAAGAVDYWTHVARDPPKCLADVVEAYIGAVFVDSQYSFQEVERFFETHIAIPFFQDMSVYDTFANDHPMIALASMLNDTYNCQDYRVLSEEVPGVGAGDEGSAVAEPATNGDGGDAQQGPGPNATIGFGVTDTHPPAVCSVVIIHDRIVVDHWSTSTRYGKAKVASKAREIIEGMAPYEYRARFGCNCKKEAKADGNGHEEKGESNGVNHAKGVQMRDIPEDSRLGTAV